MNLCEAEYKAAFKLATQRPVNPPGGLTGFREAVTTLATACWHYRVSHKDLLKDIIASHEFDAPLVPELVNKLTKASAERLSKKPWMRNAVSAKIESEIMGLCRVMAANRSDQRQTDEELFSIAVGREPFRADLVYVLAMINGYGNAAGRVLPAAIWSLRTHPLRQKIFREMMEQGRGVQNDNRIYST